MLKLMEQLILSEVTQCVPRFAQHHYKSDALTSHAQACCMELCRGHLLHDPQETTSSMEIA